MFGRYELVELIGRGGMGEVYRAFDPKHGRTVALKMLLPELSGDPNLAKRFMLECRAAASLNDPHVIPIHDSGETDGRLYIDMRYIEGTDLEKIIARDRFIAPRRTALLMHQAAEALDAAHAEKLIHRDVKPSNLLATKQAFVYLIDFGIVHILGAPTTLNPRTEVGTVIGTWHYMAPERFTDPERTDPRVDVYSLACVLYECLTGQRPFPMGDKFAVAHAHLEVPPPRVSDLRPELRAFDRIVARGMAKDPDERYRSAGDLAIEVDSVASALGSSNPIRPAPTAAGSVDPSRPTVRGRTMVPDTPNPPSPNPQPPQAVSPDTHRGLGTPTVAVRPEPTSVGPTPLPHVGPHGQTATRADPPPTRLLPPGAVPPDGADALPPDSPAGADRPRRRHHAGVLVASGVLLVILMVVLGEMLSRDETTGGPDDVSGSPSSSAAAPPSSTAPATSPSVTTRTATAEGDLGIPGVPISVLPCDGRWITMVGSAYASETSANKQQIAGLLSEFPGSAYLLADAGCHSQLPGGTHARNYRVFLGPFDFQAQACAARPASVSDSWVKPLDDTTDPDMAFCLAPQHSR